MVKIINAIDDKTNTINIEFKDITINELLGELNVNKMHVGAVLVNGIPKRLSEKFPDSSEVYILPVLGGGC
jgi:hypothetical protein